MITVTIQNEEFGPGVQISIGSPVHSKNQLVISTVTENTQYKPVPLYKDQALTLAQLIKEMAEKM